MYPWQNQASGVTVRGPPRGNLATTAAPSSPSSYPVPQMRWLPSMASHPRSQPQHQPRPSSHVQHPGILPPTFRMPRGPNVNPHTQSQPHSPIQPVTLSDGERSPGSSPESGRNTGTRNASISTNATAPYTWHTNGSHNQMQRRTQVHPTAGIPRPEEEDIEDASTVVMPRRHHGKRLTMREEVTLFEICNRHARDFGQRSNLCNWWRMVTDEFTCKQGHPYSWHSVRRKVEIVTKQRMKALEGQGSQSGGSGIGSTDENIQDPQLQATIDAWIPTWQRWEKAEAKRIKERDSYKNRRKRKDRLLEGSGADAMSDEGWNAKGSADGGNNASAGTRPHMLPPPTSVRLPPGFESMFAGQTPHTTGSRNRTYYNSTLPYQAPPYSSPSSMGLYNAMMSAVLETMNKLSSRLDSVPQSTDSHVSPVLSALLPNADSPSQFSVGTASRVRQDDNRSPTLLTVESFGKLKEELRLEIQAEMRRELRKDMAGFEEKLDSVQRTQDMILEMLRQEPS